MCTSEDIADSLHGESLLCSLNEQRMQGFLCDVTIVVEDTKFKAHRNILAASSLYFRNHFRSQSILIQGHVLELNDLKADTFTEILNFIYSSKIAVKKKETLTDLVDAGKKLGITFLENIKASKKSTAVACSTEPEGNAPPAFYRGENGLKSETVEKKGDDPAITNGPRITNAFSILETEANGFSPLDLRANFKKSTGPTEEVHSGGNCENGVCTDGEPVNTLAEHSYAVSSGDSSFKRDSVFEHGNKGSHTKDQECTPGGITTNQEAKSANSMPVLEPQFSSQAVIQTCTSNSVSSSSEKTANQTEFYSQREDESMLPQLPAGNPPVTQSFCDAGLYPLPKKHHVTFNCKNCSKEFAHFKRLQRHEQICFKVVHMDRDVRIPNNHSQGASTENYCTPSESTTNQNALTNGSSSATDHFVKIVDDKIFYVCIVCKRNYLTLSSLRRHSNVHSWRKSYPCHYCNKVFALAEYRTKHEIWHTGDRRYQCIFCLETFMTYYILKNHQKSSHGIDPRLGVGSKANRGLKPSIYPYKLYRLLPMKCKRPPLKTPRTTSTAHFQVQNSFTMPTVVTNTLNTQPFSVNSQDPFSSTLDAPSQNVTSSTTTQDTWPFDIIQSDKNTSVLPVGKANSPSRVSTSTLKQSGSAPGPQFSENQNIPSVINAKNSAPSVIMHSSRVSSVIMHGNAITSSASTNGIGWNPSRNIVSPDKDTSQETNSEATEANTEMESPTGYKNGDAHQDEREFSFPAPSSKSNKSVIREGNKTETYIAKPALPGTLVNSGIAPLCQITVKIGSEALVKRQISGSSLFFRKSGRPKHSEPETSWLDSDDDKRERCSIRLRRSDSVQMEEMCDDASDQDVSDKPWRPYYNYKPKKKSKHFKKFRKLKKRKKHSRPRSTEENVSEVDTKGSSGEAIDDNTNGGDDSPETLDFECPPEKTTEEQDKAVEQDEAVEQEMTATQWQLDTKACFCELCQKSFRNPSTLKVHMRCHTGEKPYSCKVCGKCFSFPGNLSKHERIHQVGKNFTCQYCNKTFLLHKTLKKHERIHTGEKMYDCKFCSQQFLHLTSRNNHEQKHLEEQSEKGFVCVQCSKVCKTAAALVMHQKKHYFRGLKHGERKELQPPAADMCTWGGTASSICDNPKMTGERSSVSMPESFPPSFDDCEAPLLSYSTGVTEVIPQNVCTASPVENVSAIGETDSSNFMTPPPLPPVALHSSVLMEVPKGWKHWKTRHYNLDENMNSENSSLKESTKTFTELKTMTSFDNPFVP